MGLGPLTSALKLKTSYEPHIEFNSEMNSPNSLTDRIGFSNLITHESKEALSEGSIEKLDELNSSSASIPSFTRSQSRIISLKLPKQHLKKKKKQKLCSYKKPLTKVINTQVAASEERLNVTKRISSMTRVYSHEQRN